MDKDLGLSSYWGGMRVLVLGAARQGTALARYLVEKGALVVLNDRQQPEELQAARQSLADLPESALQWYFGGHPLELLDTVDLVCLSGGVSLDLPVVQEALKRGIPLSNDSQIFLEAAPCPVIGITGSAGKTTTTTLVGRMAQATVDQAARVKDSTLTSAFVLQPSNVYVGGNIGSPLIAVVDQMSPSDLAVMELSSFQLEIMTRSPQVAAILNVTPNHLDRHPSMQAYMAAKQRILDFQREQDTAVLGREDPGAWGLVDHVEGDLFSFGRSWEFEGEGTFCRSGNIYIRMGGDEHFVMPRSSISLRGEHNLLNVLAACAISAAARLPVEAMQAGVAGFMGVPHRLELVREWKGSLWYNDSIATAPERVVADIRSFEEPLILLAGGRDKNLPWGDFAALARQKVDHLILFGEAGEKVMAAMEAARQGEAGRPYTITRCKGLEEAVQVAAQLVEAGDVVLLSPGGTSFDEFRDFEDRGEAFRKWVMTLP